MKINCAFNLNLEVIRWWFMIIIALTLLGWLFLCPDTFHPTLTSPQLYWNIIEQFENGHNILLLFLSVGSLTCRTIDEFLFPCKWKSQMIWLVCINEPNQHLYYENVLEFVDVHILYDMQILYETEKWEHLQLCTSPSKKQTYE